MLTSQCVDELYACPFCRQLFAPGEVELCPDCDIKVTRLAELPPSLEAQLLEPEDQTPPEDERHELAYVGRGRGALIMVALFGIGAFFAPWMHETAPDIRTLSGFEFARELPWLWAAGIAWMVMLPLIVSRRTIRQMRGARVAVGFLAAMVLMTVLVRLLAPHTPLRFIPHHYSWVWGMYMSGFLGAIALALAVRFGGSLAEMKTRERRRGYETLH